MRQIILDTETTGIGVENGHRIIEIGCVEMINRRLTGKHFHYYLNPQREVDAGAQAVHGLSTAFLQDKPLFSSIVDEFLEFVAVDELIIHNAPFDVAFLNYELSLARRGLKTIQEYCTIVDTLPLARQLHVGQRNSLDALCKRYAIDNSKRDFHGALLDAHLLAQVYLAMTGGQGSFFDTFNENQHTQNESKRLDDATIVINQHKLVVLKANAAEIDSHQEYLSLLRKKGKCLWQD